MESLNVQWTVAPKGRPGRELLRCIISYCHLVDEFKRIEGIFRKAFCFEETVWDSLLTAKSLSTVKYRLAIEKLKVEFRQCDRTCNMIKELLKKRSSNVPEPEGKAERCLPPNDSTMELLTWKFRKQVRYVLDKNAATKNQTKEIRGHVKNLHADLKGLLSTKRTEYMEKIAVECFDAIEKILREYI